MGDDSWYDVLDEQVRHASSSSETSETVRFNLA